MKLSPNTKRVVSFWGPLSLTWSMMAAEGPIVTAVIARGADPKHNLAAFGVAFALALVVEAPVIMILSATTALVRDKASFLLVRRFIYLVSAATAIAMCAVASEPLFSWIAGSVLDLNPVLRSLVRWGLFVMIPWPPAIGYRRFYQGILLKAERPDIVARCTVFRITGIAATTLALFHMTGLDGVVVGCGSLSVAVVLEAIATRIAAAPYIARYHASTAVTSYHLTFADLLAFYIPLSLTSLVGLCTNAIYSLFLSRAVMSLESLAVMPVVNSLSWFVQSIAIALEETVIVLSGDHMELLPNIRRFACCLAIALISVLITLSVTPLSQLWFTSISSVPSELVPLARNALAVLCFMPALTITSCVCQAILIKMRKTPWVTLGTLLNATLVIAALSVTTFWIKLPGYYAAPVAQMSAAAITALYFALRAKAALTVPRHRPNV